MERVKFIFGTINAPPVAAGHDELELYYQGSVKPFLTQLYKYPEIPITMYYSGPFLDWLANHHAEYLSVLGEMLRRKQVEILGGAFFSPLLPLVPGPDRLGQIEDLTTALRKQFGKRPRGCWLTKGVWDSALVTNLCNSSLEYTFLDENCFAAAGLDGEAAFRPALTEHHGKLLTVIPQAGRFASEIYEGSYLSFFKAMEERAGTEDGVLALFLPAEQLDSQAFFVADWGLEKFLPMLRDYYGVWEGVHPGNFLKKLSRVPERTYFPNTTWQDLLRAHPLPRPAGQRPASQTYRHFLSLYPEANLLYSKMVFVHLLAYQIRGDKYKKKGVLEDLWRGQSHQAYFPWLEGGLLESHYRKSAFSSLLSAELAVREKATFAGTLTAQDFNLDGIKEYLFLGKDFNFFVDPRGASLFELDAFKAVWNYQDALADHFGPQPRVRRSFSDLFFLPGEQPSTAQDLGGLAGQEFRVTDFDRELQTVSLTCRAELTLGGQVHPIKVKKTFAFQEDGLALALEIESLSTRPLTVGYANEFYFSLKQADLPDDHVVAGDTSLVLQDQRQALAFHLVWDTPAAVSTGLHTTADARLYGVRHYQAHAFWPHWTLELAPGSVWKQSLALKIKSL